MGRKESNQTKNKANVTSMLNYELQTHHGISNVLIDFSLTVKAAPHE